MYIYFAILGIFFLYLDLIKNNIIKLTLAATFLFDAILAYKFSNNTVLLFTSFILFFCIFYFSIKIREKREKRENLKQKNLSSYIGKKVKVIKDIGKTLSIDGIGLIKINNDIWQAKNINDKEIKAGSEVEIISKENMIMNVKAIK